MRSRYTSNSSSRNTSSMSMSAPQHKRCDSTTYSGETRHLPPFPQWRRLPVGLIVPSLAACLIYLFLWKAVDSTTFSMMGKSMVWNIPMQRGTSALLRQSSSSSRYRMLNVVLMGQFNYDVGPDIVKSWAKIWSKYFKHIVAAGPFSIATYCELQSSGIQVLSGRSDKGYVSPYGNLLRTMLKCHHPRKNNKDDSSRTMMDIIDGVLYAHDDALLNITMLFEGDETLPVNVIIRAREPNVSEEKSRMQYSIYVEHQRWRWSDGKEESQVSPVLYFENTPQDTTINRTMHSSLVALADTLPKWAHTMVCLQQQVQMLSKYDETWWEVFSDYSSGPALSENVIGAPNNRGENLTSEVISRNSYRFSFPGFEQSDFLYMPLQYTELFEQAARPHILKGKVFLECAIPTIVQWVIQAAKKKKSMVAKDSRPQNDPDLDEDSVVAPKLKEVPLCTDWSLNTRGTDSMLMNCMHLSSDWGVFHPKKLGSVGPKGAADYELWLDQIQRPPTNATLTLLAAALDTHNSTKASATDSIES